MSREFVVSPTLCNTFDACERKAAFRIARFPKEDSPSAARGTRLHAAVEAWRKGDPKPPTDPDELATYEAAIAVPFGGDDFETEKWVKVTDGEVVLGGKVDEYFRAPKITDHKFTSNLKYALSSDDLARDPQAATYAACAMVDEESDACDLEWRYTLTKKPHTTRLVRAHVSREDVEPMIDRLLDKGKKIVALKKVLDSGVHPNQAASPNLKSCWLYNARCEYADHCVRTLSESLGGKSKMDVASQVSAVLDAPPPPPPPPSTASVPAPPPPPPAAHVPTALTTAVLATTSGATESGAGTEAVDETSPFGLPKRYVAPGLLLKSTPTAEQIAWLATAFPAALSVWRGVDFWKIVPEGALQREARIRGAGAEELAQLYDPINAPEGAEPPPPAPAPPSPEVAALEGLGRAELKALCIELGLVDKANKEGDKKLRARLEAHYAGGSAPPPPPASTPPDSARSVLSPPPPPPGSIEASEIAALARARATLALSPGYTAGSAALYTILDSILVHLETSGK